MLSFFPTSKFQDPNMEEDGVLIGADLSLEFVAHQGAACARACIRKIYM